MSNSAFDSEQSYVSQQPGWRIVFIALVVAAILGLSFRLYFSPQRIKTWIEAELKKQPAKIELKFKTAELRLARGMIPQLAIRLTDVEGRSARSCAKTPGFRVSEMYIPFRVVPLLEGKVAVGTVHGQTAAVDLDALRDRCEAAAKTEPTEFTPPPSPPPSNAAARAALTGGVRPWWTPEQLQTVKSLVGGFSFESVELRFEKAAKYVVFEDLSVRADAGPDAVFLSTDVRVPPESLFGQSLLPFALEANVKSDSAEIEIKGNLAEGNLNGLASLKAVPGDVAIDAHLHAVSVPLSALLPFARRAGWLTQNLKPKFLWLQCEASIRGQARRLFQENPLTIEKCALEGESGRLAIEKAVIGPRGKIEPFEVALAGVDIERWLAIFGKRGPSGVMSKLGRLSGRASIIAKDEFAFDGALTDAQILFSRRSVRVQQALPEVRGHLAHKSGRWSAAVEEIQVAGGTFSGKLSLDVDPAAGAGALRVTVGELRLHPDVEELLVGGGWHGLSLDGKGELADGRLAGFKGEMKVKGVEAKLVRLNDFAARVSLEGPRAKIEATIPVGEIRKGAHLFEVAKPVFLGHDFAEEWVAFKGAAAHVFLQDRDLRWEKGAALFRNGQIWLTTAGTCRDNGTIEGWIGVDYPKFKNMRWDLSGKTTSPELAPTERTRRETGGRDLDDAALGISIPAVKAKPASEAPAVKDAGLRQLGEKVLKRAKSILPIVDEQANQ